MNLKISLIFTLIASICFANTGKISGVILDEATQQPLPGVNVILEGTNMGTASDLEGNFTVTDIPVGFYNVRFSSIGYKPVTKINIRVVTNRPAIIRAELVQQAIELQEVTVTREYFEKEKDAVVSSRTVDLNEIRRDPAGAIDIQRMMQALPSVVSAADQMNEIVVRGGSAGENLFLMDNIEIANPNHFSQPGTGGGPINMLNTLFIDRVDFMAGAFPAKYGDKASSVMDISLREGNRIIHSQDVDMSMAGIGIVAEGPIINGTGSYMTSIRKSYLDLIIANTGLTSVPRYWNFQTKVVYDLSPADKFMFNVVYGNDSIILEDESSAVSRGAENVDVKDQQLAYGLTYKKLWGKKGLTNLTLGGTQTQFHYDVYRTVVGGGKQYYADQDFIEWDFQTKGDFLWKINSRMELSGGLDWKQLGMDYNSHISSDTVWTYVYSFPGVQDTFIVVDQNTWETNIYPIINNAIEDSIFRDEDGIWNYTRQNPDGSWDKVRFKQFIVDTTSGESQNQKNESHPRLGAYVQLKYHVSKSLMLNMGLRSGYFGYTDFSWLSPRLGFSYALNPVTSINAAYGRHFQSPNMMLISFDDGNVNLRSKFNDQYVIGLEHFFSKDTRGTIEAYSKVYQDIPVRFSETTLDSADVTDLMVNKGRAKSYGVELFLQKKMAKNFFGTFSYSWYRAFSQDVRFTDETKYYPQTFDFQHVASIIGGYRIPLKGSNIIPISERNGVVRLIAKVLGWGSDELELSFRYRYVGGKPYTPLTYNHHVQKWFEDPSADYNTDRLLPYHRLDIMILWHSNFRRFNVISYFDLQNVFNRDNIWDIQWNSDGTTSNINQFKIFPVGGVTIEF